MLKKIILCTTVIMVLVATGCQSKKSTKIDGNEYAGSMVFYVNYSGKVVDNVIEELQRDLKLNIQQTEILLLMKSDLLAKVPEVRSMAVSFQAKLITVLEKETITEDDVNELYAELDVYNQILRDTVVVRLVELHRTLDVKQKEKLASYLDKGKIIPLPAAKPVAAPVYKVTNRTYQLYRELNFSRDQIVMEMKYAREMKGLLKDKMKSLKKEGIAQKEALKELIMSDSFDVAQIDAIFNENIALFDDMKEKTTENIVAFHASLTESQKNSLVSYVSDFELE